MKIGILSMQRVVNNGSFLQAYGLKKVLESFNSEVQFVDFRIDSNQSTLYNWKDNLNNNHIYIFILFLFLKKLIKFDFKDWRLAISSSKFAHNYRKNYLKTLNIEEKANFSPEVDVLVFGSDEVFNTVQYVTLYNKYVWELYGANNKAKKMISYAASFGHTTVKGLENNNMLSTAKSYLDKFSCFSVRDKNSYDIIKSLTNRESSINIDPVLLYDFRDVDIKKPNLENYILVYAYPGRINAKEEIKAIQSFAKKYNKKLVCVNIMQTWCDQIIYAHPLELLSYFKYADYVVTDTFHGAVLSIKYNRPFVQFIRNSSNYSNNQKVGYLLQSFGLEDRILMNIKDFEQCLLERIDYRSVNQKIIVEQERSISYLQQALKFD